MQKFQNKKNHPAQIAKCRASVRAMMIWRQMENIYGTDWITMRGPQAKRDGTLSYVAKTWVLALGQYSDVHIRMALAALAKQHSETPGSRIPSIFEFRAVVEQVYSCGR